MSFFLERFALDDWQEDLEDSFDKGIIDDSQALVDPKNIAKLITAIKKGQYQFMPPREQKIPKKGGGERTVYICNDIDRIVLRRYNNLLFKYCGDMIHPRCKSYQKGLSTHTVVKEVVEYMATVKGETKGFKADLQKYFDSVQIKYIDEKFEQINKVYGRDPLTDTVQRLYHQNLCEKDGQIVEHYFSLGQGIATASWLADAMLYDIDEKMSALNIYYVRYSDDILVLGEEWEKALNLLKQLLAEKELVLNPKKVSVITNAEPFEFLGFSICGKKVSFSKESIKTFQKEIEKRTISSKNKIGKAIKEVMNYLYGSPLKNEFCWATARLTTVNVERDIQLLNKFVLDCLRAVLTGRKKLYGLGYQPTKKGVVATGKGQHVKSNRLKTEKQIPNYISLKTARNALLVSRECFNALRRSVIK